MLEDEVIQTLKRAHARLVFEKVEVATVRELTADALSSLFRGRIAAIHVKRFADPSLAKRAAAGMVSTKAKRWFLDGYETDMSYLKHLGEPGRESAYGTERRARYHATAVRNLRRVRALFAPHLSPVDRLRLELDELWPKGANLREVSGRKYGAGVVRVMRPERFLDGRARTEGICHIDDLMEPGTPRLFSACIYLRVPPSGGELAIWGLELTRRHRRNPFYRLLGRGAFLPGAPEAVHEVIGPPSVTLTPSAGDLILFDTARPHAVRGFARGDRVQSQSFVAFDGVKEPLALFA